MTDREARDYLLLRGRPGDSLDPRAVARLQRSEEVRKFLAGIKNRACPECGGPMIHTRLNGYVCAGRCH